MKYHPIIGTDRFNRDYLGEHWNRKYIRAVQTILNATKGKIGVGQSFFEKAFGNTEDEFHEILIMPEIYILLRFFFEGIGLTQEWKNDFKNLNHHDREHALKLIHANHIKSTDLSNLSNPLKMVLRHYALTRDHVFMDDKKKYHLLDSAKNILALRI